ncbi:MAG: dTDP-4-dehydrorhamnose reductase [Azoarcus sp.]|jgi:dTDP-4-dehydrorhamnose reductase|nr:dTDP-4-dehydrorhamnose reductase [Azoarcus sp.]
MKILLLGKNGQIGRGLQRALAPLGDVVAFGNQEGDHFQVDLTDEAALRAAVVAAAPSVIVNAAAYTAVDRAESEPELAHSINATAVGVLAAEAAARGVWLVHYSTDYVFDGSGKRPWREDDRPAPLSVYGKTKLAGEEAIRASGCRHLILRTSWVYSACGDNFVRTILRLAAERERLTVVADQVGAPTGADWVADMTAHLLRVVTDDRVAAPGGTYHLAAAGETSWNGYARFVIDEARHRHGLDFRLREIVPILSSAWPAPAMRPLNSRLDTTRVQAEFGFHPPDWRFGVARLLDEIL